MLDSRISILAALLMVMIGSVSSAFAQDKTSGQATAEFKQLLSLQAALKKIPMNKQNREPHKSFLKRNQKKIVYSDPSAMYYVRSELFWNLRAKYKDLSIADDIAWAAARNDLPGECEGFLTCNFTVLTETDIKYLRFYPNGKHSRKALAVVSNDLASTVEDLGKNAGHTGPEDAAEKSELAKLLAAMRSVVSKVSHPEKTKLLVHIKKIEEFYK